jgi:hypothetical protein
MKIIEVKKDGHPVGLLIDPKGPDSIIGEDKLKRLRPYILKLINRFGDSELKSLQGKLKIIMSSDGQAAFTIDSTKEEKSSTLLSPIKKLQRLCKDHLTEQLIVPQSLGEGMPVIHHRVMEFEVKDNMRMVVKYVVLGEFNNFDTAMSDIAEQDELDKERFETTVSASSANQMQRMKSIAMSYILPIFTGIAIGSFVYSRYNKQFEGK